MRRLPKVDARPFNERFTVEAPLLALQRERPKRSLWHRITQVLHDWDRRRLFSRMPRRAFLIPGSILISIFSFQLSAFGASWYVDGTLATGANNGTSWADAWRALSSISWASMSAGDTLYISGGSTSKTYGALTAGKGGSAGNPITIRVGQDAGHNGTVIVNGAGWSIDQNYLTLNGDVSGESRLKFQNNYNHLNSEAGVCLSAFQKTGVTVASVTFSNVNNGMYFNQCLGYTVRNCYAYHLRGEAFVRSIQTTGGWDNNNIYSNYVEMAYQTAIPAGGPSCGSAPCAYAGPDGIQCGSGTSAWANTFRVRRTTEYTSTQHPDTFQIAGQRIKIYRNEFINVGDSCIDMDVWASGVCADIYIYNNVFRCEEQIDPYPGYMRFYCSWNKTFTSISNVKILNNTIVDQMHLDPWTAIEMKDYRGGTPTITDCVIANNIIVNAGFGGQIYIAPGTSGSWTFAGNVSYLEGAQVPVFTQGGTSTPQSEALPTFTQYVRNDPGNILSLSANDTACIDQSVGDYSSIFNTDFTGQTRTNTFDVGAYEYGTSEAGGPSEDPVMSVPPETVAFGDLLTNTYVEATFTVQNVGQGTLTGTASASAPFSVQSGSPWSLTAGQTTPVVVRYTPTSAGVHSDVVTFDSNANDTTRAVSGLAGILQATNTWLATNMTFTSAWESLAGNLSNTVQTTYGTAGRAVTWFNVAAHTNHTLVLTLSASADNANSVWVGMNANPADPSDVFHITNFPFAGEITVTGQGNGTFDNPGVVPVYYDLDPDNNPHKLVILTREPVSITEVTIASPAGAPDPPPPPPEDPPINTARSAPWMLYFGL